MNESEENLLFAKSIVQPEMIRVQKDITVKDVCLGLTCEQGKSYWEDYPEISLFRRGAEVLP